MILIALSILLVAGILILTATSRTKRDPAEDRARQKLISIVESIDTESNDSDYISKDGLRLVIRNSRTREFLLHALTTAKAEEVTGCSTPTLPAPLYSVSEKCIGGDLFFNSAYTVRSFYFILVGKNRSYFYTYIAAIEQAGELFGIECTDDPSYLDLVPKHYHYQ